jgi:hypothetical protein
MHHYAWLVLCLDWPGTTIILSLLPSLAPVAEMTGVLYHIQLLLEMGVLLRCCLGCPQTVILLVSLFLVAGITDLSHCTRPETLWLTPVL